MKKKKTSLLLWTGLHKFGCFLTTVLHHYSILTSYKITLKSAMNYFISNIRATE